MLAQVALVIISHDEKGGSVRERERKTRTGEKEGILREEEERKTSLPWSDNAEDAARNAQSE